MSASWSLIAFDAVMWPVISVLAGLGFSMVPDRLLDRDTFVSRIRPFEHRGRVYRRVWAVHRWKDRLPEANGLGRRHPSKRTLPGRAAIPAYLRETRRAEYVHVTIAASSPLFLLWNPVGLGLVMVAFGVAFNAPFIVVQRYNRARMLALPSQQRRPAPRADGVGEEA